jgi:SSS family solute:Na+ symporter
MNLHALDWTIVGFFIVVLTALTLYCRQFVGSVVDFLAGGRVAGRYLLTVSQGLIGAISIIANWEMIYAAGFPSQWWLMLSVPVMLLLAVTGFIGYRFRQTRALTLAQFFEARYSRRFRFFAGLLSWVSGVLNYGIFPAITARFLIYFLGIPTIWDLAGFHIPTLPLMMAGYLGFALFTALTGGQVSIMITDFFQGMLTMVLFVVILLFLLNKFHWNDVISGLQTAPEGHSLINPFKASKEEDFNVFYYIVFLFAQIYNARSWQGTSGFNSAARTPHEAQMSGILVQWRTFTLQLCIIFVPLAAYAVLHLPKFADVAAPILSQLAAIQDPTLRQEMTVPLFLTHVLPVGLMGFFAAILFSSAISCDNSYLHSWGSILIQDVILPLRKKPLEPKRHLLLLRLSMVGVAAFGFCFSLLFPLKQYVSMYFAITGAIYMGGAGAVIIGGLYWSRGTTAAAWSALISGSILAFGGLAIQQTWTSLVMPTLNAVFPHSAWLAAHAAKFPVNGQTIFFVAMVTASLLYVGVSLLGPRQVYDMDRLLHRGAHALPEDALAGSVNAKRTWGQVIGLTREFTKADRVLLWVTFWWSMGWWLIFLLGTIYNSIWGTTDAEWSIFWWIKTWVSILLGIAVCGWIVCGGVKDAIALFRDLKKQKASDEDDGRVDPREKALARKEG